ncbi:MAG: hypothetical protein JW751_01460 [Polyangiaceae bacterium]|nr:hypothetical protein [Polyangiaceae bacterium]
MAILPRIPTVGFCLASGLLAFAGQSACTRADPSTPSQASPSYFSHSPKVCGIDEAREYFCDELLPRESALPAVPPYEDCPGVVDEHVGELDPTPTVAVFDPSYTEHIRKRQPPGNSCCYSWCSKITLRDPATVDPRAGCDDARAIRETYCLDEPEAGTSRPSPSPYERCPDAIAPPEVAAFYAPQGALFDPTETGTRRQRGFRECCYAWCSVVPQGGVSARW